MDPHYSCTCMYIVITRKYGAVLEKPDEQRALAVPRGPTRALGKFPFFLGDLILRELATLHHQRQMVRARGAGTLVQRG